MRCDRFNFSSNYPFGIEIEICNKTIRDIDCVFLNDSRLVGKDSSYEEILNKYGEETAMSNKYYYYLSSLPNRYWGLTAESTDENDSRMGSEIFSPILYNANEDLQAINNILDILIECGADVNELCGLHVHVGALPFQNNYKKLFNFFLFHILFEPVFYKFSAMGNFGYVRDYAYAYANPVSFKINGFRINELTLDKYIRDNRSAFHKEGALHFKDFNLNDFSYGSSFETRIFNGTLNAKVVENYIDMVLSSVAYSVSDDFDQEEMIKRCIEAVKIRKKWREFQAFVDYADELVDEFVSKVFIRKIDKDLFYEQYSGKCLSKKYIK